MSKIKYCMFFVIVLLAACTSESPGSAPRSDIQFRLIESYDCTTCQELPFKNNQGTLIPLPLGKSIVEAEDIRSIKARSGNPNVITFYISNDSAAKIEALTGNNIGKSVAIVARERIFGIANIQSAFSESMELSGMTDEELNDVFFGVIDESAAHKTAP